jgi:hypothetical protein
MSDNNNDGLNSKVAVLLIGAGSAAIWSQSTISLPWLGAAPATELDITEQSHNHTWMNQQDKAQLIPAYKYQRVWAW